MISGSYHLPVPASAIFLVGLSGSGKSTVGRLVAERHGLVFVDTDRAIEGSEGRSVEEIFRADGEARFRELEAAALHGAGRRPGTVVATGGGAPTTPEGRDALQCGTVVYLDVSPTEAARRLSSDPRTEMRPLLAGNAEARLQELHTARDPVYREVSQAILDVDGKTPAMVAAMVSATAGLPNPEPAARVSAPGGNYGITVERGALGQLGAICRAAGLKGRAFVITDQDVVLPYGMWAAESLSLARYDADVFAIEPGEEHKTLETVGHLYDWMLGARLERQDFAVCVGGGVVTDLGGFAAATVLRGIPFVHVPTSMLAMTDAAIGGKTGVDHPRGKNLIGAFAQPAAVVIDPLVLSTLSGRQRRNGWAEVLKHGLILDEPLLRDLEARADAGDAMLDADLIGRSCAIKAAVVSEDEREAGRRTLLNYGHTLGHAIETVTGYEQYLHGEAVAIGMHAAGLMAVELGLLAPADLDRQQRVLRAYGLPERAPGLDAEALIDATRGDKKVADGAVRWVLLKRLGEAYLHGPIDQAVVRRAVEAVTAP